MRKSTSSKVPGISKTIPSKYSEVSGLERTRPFWSSRSKRKYPKPMSHWLLISNHWPVGIKSAPQSLWESDGSRVISIKRIAHQPAFLTLNHSHYWPWIFPWNLNCFTCISQVVGQENTQCIKSLYMFYTRITFIEGWGYQRLDAEKCW